MQGARIVKGATDRSFGKTVSEKLNEIFLKHPETRLESCQIVGADKIECAVLCIFDLLDEGREGDKGQGQGGNNNKENGEERI